MATVEGAFPGALLCRPPEEGPGGEEEEEGPPPPDPPSLALPRGGRRRRRTTTSCRKKHKMEEEPEDVPAAKKRLVEEMLLGTGMAEWALSAGQPPPQPLHCLPGPLDAPCEEMEQATVEPQCEAARRRLQEIEARIIDEEEEEEEEQEGEKGLLGAGGPSLPTLVLSDTLKTGLKQDYEGVLTKKIIESMSRPSMELVLWKPLPAFLAERAQPVSVRNYKAEHPLTKPEALETAFLSPVDGFADQPPAEMPPPLLYGAVDSPHAAEEEMEL